MSSLNDDDGVDVNSVCQVCQCSKEDAILFLNDAQNRVPVRKTHTHVFHVKRKHRAGGDTEILHDKDTSGGNAVE